MYTVIENLINYKFYENVDEILRKLTLYNSYKVLGDEEYQKLMNLAIEKYKIVEEKKEEIINKGDKKTGDVTKNSVNATSVAPMQ